MNGVSEQYVRGHSGDQLFFVAFAQVGSLYYTCSIHTIIIVCAYIQLWCSKYTSDALEVSTRTDPHSQGPIQYETWINAYS